MYTVHRGKCIIGIYTITSQARYCIVWCSKILAECNANLFFYLAAVAGLHSILLMALAAILSLTTLPLPEAVKSKDLGDSDFMLKIDTDSNSDFDSDSDFGRPRLRLRPNLLRIIWRHGSTLVRRHHLSSIEARRTVCPLFQSEQPFGCHASPKGWKVETPIGVGVNHVLSTPTPISKQAQTADSNPLRLRLRFQLHSTAHYVLLFF